MIVITPTETDRWELTDDGAACIEGTADVIIRFLALRLGCKVSITEQRVATHGTVPVSYDPDDGLVQRLIAERNADGRHPIG